MSSPKEDSVLYEVRDSVGWVTFNRPEARNSFTFDMYDRLAEICAAASTDGEVRSIVMMGAGGKAFAAGTDISQFRSFKTEQDVYDYEERGSQVMRAIEECSVPTIAAIQGACTGGGAAVAASCDLRIGAPSARFGFPIARTLGNCLSIVNYARLSMIIGSARVREIILTARLVGAEESLRIGWLNEVVTEEGQLLPRAAELATAISRHAPLTMKATKAALLRIRDQWVPQDGRDLIRMCYMSEDFQEGIEAFLSKRLPVWKGR